MLLCKDPTSTCGQFQKYIHNSWKRKLHYGGGNNLQVAIKCCLNFSRQPWDAAPPRKSWHFSILNPSPPQGASGLSFPAGNNSAGLIYLETIKRDIFFRDGLDLRAKGSFLLTLMMTSQKWLMLQRGWIKLFWGGWRDLIVRLIKYQVNLPAHSLVLN